MAEPIGISEFDCLLCAAQFQPTMPPTDVVLYTRRNCCLCDEAKTLLGKHNVSVSEVDIDEDPELRQRYDQCVPVVTIDGQERFRGRINEVLLRRFLNR